jgi:hypothetical protein
MNSFVILKKAYLDVALILEQRNTHNKRPSVDGQAIEN